MIGHLLCDPLIKHTLIDRIVFSDLIRKSSQTVYMETGNCTDKFNAVVWLLSTTLYTSSKISSNSEAFASELLEYIEDI